MLRLPMQPVRMRVCHLLNIHAMKKRPPFSPFSPRQEKNPTYLVWYDPQIREVLNIEKHLAPTALLKSLASECVKVKEIEAPNARTANQNYLLSMENATPHTVLAVREDVLPLGMLDMKNTKMGDAPSALSFSEPTHETRTLGLMHPSWGDRGCLLAVPTDPTPSKLSQADLESLVSAHLNARESRLTSQAPSKTNQESSQGVPTGKKKKIKNKSPESSALISLQGPEARKRP